ncbi:hypothetical protein D3C80_1256290 [compost metagenome]
MWLANEVALHIVHANPFQRDQLLHAFHIFSHYRQPLHARNLADRRNDLEIHRIGQHVTHETAVDFQHVDRQHLQPIVAGIAGAEVIQRNATPHLTQCLQIGPGIGRILQQMRFGHFQRQLIGLNLVLLQQAVDIVAQHRPAQRRR